MIVDTSAIIAVLRGEPEREAFLAALRSADAVAMSAATYVECGIVVDRLADPVLSRRFDELLAALGIRVVDVDEQQARTARAAHRDFGRGSGHRARLNLGDCFSYALAVTTGRPLLFKGDHFRRTGVRAAATSPVT